MLFIIKLIKYLLRECDTQVNISQQEFDCIIHFLFDSLSFNLLFTFFIVMTTFGIKLFGRILLFYNWSNYYPVWVLDTESK